MLIFLLAGMSACNNGYRGNNNFANLPQKEIRDLSSAIRNANLYREEMNDQIEMMEDTLERSSDPRRKCDVALNLSSTFRTIDTDSSLYYAHEAKNLALRLPEPYLNRANIAVVNALATAGLFIEATNLFNQIPLDSLPRQTKVEYFLSGRILYAYMKWYVQGDQPRYAVYNAQYQRYVDSLMVYLPKDSHMKSFLVCERQIREKHYEAARKGLERLLEEVPQGDNLYGMSAFQMAMVYQDLGDDSNYAAYLALSALSDIKGCVAEGMALPRLADWLYQKGDFTEAFSFINFALREATNSNARMSALSIARLVPIIDKAYQEKINATRKLFIIYLVLVTVLLVATAVLIIILSRQIKLARGNAEKLVSTSRRQESYIGNFIGLYSRYADRFNSLIKLVGAKLAAGQVAELKKLIDSGKFADKENDDIQKIFDSAFLDIYPDFVKDINSLLRPEEAIVVKAPDMLIPELRIYAFVKLGVDESTRIAQILHYSINTVYTYRNRMRNKAINRDTFDSDVKNL